MADLPYEWMLVVRAYRDGRVAPRCETPEEFAQMLREGVCPFCGRDGFRMVAMHVRKHHDVSAVELRDAAGLLQDESICDSVLSSERRRRAFELHKSGVFAYDPERSGPGRRRSPRATRRRKAVLGFKTEEQKQALLEGARRAETWRIGAAARAAKARANPPAHGTLTRHKNGCRCAECVAAANAYAREYKARNHDRVYRLAREAFKRRMQLPPKRFCETEGCNQRHVAKGLCSRHYQASRRAS